MKMYRIILLVSIFGFVACGGSTDNSSQDAGTSPAADLPSSVPDFNANTAVTPPPTPPAEPAQNAEGVWHYTCPSGCEGGAGAAEPCAKCGTTLVHNSGYHNSGNAEQPPAQLLNTDGSPLQTTATPTSPPTTPPIPSPEPAQNATGVWHYVCSNGCAGGAGSATPCPKCGATLTHNSAYHQ